MSKAVFIPIPLDEFNAKVEALVKEAVKNGMRNQSQFQLVTIEELMQTLKVTKMSIHNWRKEGWLPYYKLGSNVRSFSTCPNFGWILARLDFNSATWASSTMP